jgi:bacterial/archaeal transporter family-2 protein
MKILLPILVVLAGAGLSLQAAWNTRLGKLLGSPVLAVLASLVVSLSALALFEATGLLPRGKLQFHGTPAWAWLGGLLGATYLVLTTVSVPITGVGTLVAATVFGQMLAGLLLDATGAFGVEKSSVTPLRVAGAIVVMAGVLMVQHRPK